MQSGCKSGICGHSASAFGNSVSTPIAALGLSGHCNGYRATVAMICNKGGFARSGLFPFDPTVVISKLDMRVWTSTPPGTADGLPQPWVSKTPQTVAESLSQSTLIKDQVLNYQGSSPTPILNSVNQLTKALVANSYQLTLLSSEIKALRKANEVLSKWRRAKRT